MEFIIVLQAQASSIVRDRMIISDGYNGTQAVLKIAVEDEEGLTRWDVLHAEANAILKVARSTDPVRSNVIYHTFAL
jgi:dCMP deaminase